MDLQFKRLTSVKYSEYKDQIRKIKYPILNMSFPRITKNPKVAFSKNVKDVFFCFYIKKNSNLEIFKLSLNREHSEHAKKKIADRLKATPSINKDFLSPKEINLKAKLFLSLRTDKLRKLFMTQRNLMVVTETKILKINPGFAVYSL